MSAMLTADWCLLGNIDTYYRKFEVYSMFGNPEMNLENALIAVAPFGGPIALVRDRNKFVQIHGGGKPVIAIYSGSGKQISSVVWSSGLIVALGWTHNEYLLCIQEDGMVFVYDIFGKFQVHVSMGQEARDHKVMDAKVFYTPQGTGVAVLTSNFKIILVNDIKVPKVRQLSQLPVSLTGAINWEVIFEKRDPEILLVCSVTPDLYRFTQGDTMALAHANPTSEGNILDIAVTVNNEGRSTAVALFTDAGYLWIGSVDLRTKYSEVLLDKRTAPKQMMWCGGEAVVCYWPGLIILVSRQSEGDTISFSYDTPLFLAQELDCVRIITNHQHEILQKVPPIVQRVLRINSIDPGSYLLEASKHFQKRSHRADEYIGLIKDKLDEAVTQCIEAAGYEFDPEVQKMLMRAAQFGKCFIADEFDPNNFVQMCRELKVLNTVRDRRIGIPITYTEMHARKYHNLLDRLVTRGFYYHAIQIAKHLRLPNEEGANRIYVHWACYKVTQSQLEWDEIAQQIANKLGHSPGISYSDIASKAEEFGRTKLAIKLLDYEPRARKQVPLLLKLKENKPALLKAIESGDTDLVYTVIFHMRENTPLADFQMIIRNFPMALSLYLKYCRDHNPQALFDIYHQEDNFNAQAAEYIRESFEPKNALSREPSLAAAQDAYKTARNDINASLCEESIRLLRHQKQFEEKFPRNKFIGKSVHDTLYLLLTINELKLAEKMRNEYKVPDRRYWWLRIQTLGEQGEWSELEKFSKSKKSPVGYAPFVDVCLKYDNTSEAVKYLPKVREDLKIKYYVKAKKFEEAAQIAYEQKDRQGLLYVQSKCGNKPAIVSKINVYVSQLPK